MKLAEQAVLYYLAALQTPPAQSKQCVNSLCESINRGGRRCQTVEWIYSPTTRSISAFLVGIVISSLKLLVIPPA
jgi:hypothetical protein